MLTSNLASRGLPTWEHVHLVPCTVIISDGTAMRIIQIILIYQEIRN
jgi:hypothetical protein